ncbi:hypothetical protein MYOV003v1_p0107 [Vibrio phage 207E48.1]|nr:hypothetical protein MYOV003v1_p0107 [Vibrio phage 207E48.1]
MKVEQYTDPFARMVAGKAMEMQLNQSEKDAALKQAKADLRKEDKREAALDMQTTLNSECGETVLFLQSAPSVILTDRADTDFHIYMCCDKIGRRVRLFCRSTTLFDTEIMQDILKEVVGDEYKTENKGAGQFQISSVEWDYVPELINKLCNEAREWL